MFLQYYEMSYGLNVEMHKQTEICKRLDAIIRQVLPFLSGEVCYFKVDQNLKIIVYAYLLFIWRDMIFKSQPPLTLIKYSKNLITVFSLL